MHIGTILVTLGLSLFLATYISQPFQSDSSDDLEKVDDNQTAENPDADIDGQ